MEFSDYEQKKEKKRNVNSNAKISPEISIQNLISFENIFIFVLTFQFMFVIRKLTNSWSTQKEQIHECKLVK